MSDDDLLRGLARAAREERAQHERAEGDPDLARPIDEKARARFADAALAAMGPAAGDGRVRHLADERNKRTRARAWAFAAVGAATLAAALLIFVRAGPQPTLPEYEVSFVGGEASSRAAPATPTGAAITVRADGHLELRLRPAHPAQGAIEVRTAAIHDGEVHLWRPNVETSADGAVRIVGDVRTLFDDPRGTWEALVALGRPGAVPDDPRAIANAAGAPHDGVRVYRVLVRIEP
jgi:hypothetical protein